MISATDNYKAALAAYRSGPIIKLITIAGYSRSFTNDKAFALSQGGGCVPWIVSIDDCDTSINDLDGGADQVTFAFTVKDRRGAITGDFPGFVFEGAIITLQLGFPGLALADFCTVFTGYIDTVASANANLEYYFSCSDVSVKLQQVVYRTADSGLPVDSNNLKTLSGHPLDMLLDILNNEIKNADQSIGLPANFIDTDKITAYRDGPFDGVQFVFHLSQPPAAADFIKNQLLKPLGGYLWVNALGAITVNFFYPLAGPVPIATLGPHDWLSIPEAEQTDMVNTVEFQFDKDDATPSASGNYFSDDVNEYGPSVARYGLAGEQVIAADGVRSAFQGFFISAIVSRLIFLRYGFKNLKFDQNAPDSRWRTMLIEPGDIVSVTHPDIQDRKAGVIGVSGKLFEILHRKFNHNEGRMTFTMLDASYLSTFGFYKIAPNSKADYTSASTADKAKYMFLCGPNGEYSNSDPGHVLG